MAELRIFHSSTGNKTVVLIHGFPFSSQMWDQACSVITGHAKEYSIVLVDLPGYGAAPEKIHWTLKSEMQDVHSKLSAMNIRMPVIGGLSMGGYAAFAYYRQFPNEVHALILSNTKPAEDTPEAKKGRDEFAADAEKRGPESVYERMLPKLISDFSKRKNPELENRLKGWIAKFSPVALAEALRAMKVRDDSTDLLKTISCPVLAITGSEDAIIPPDELKNVSRNIADAQFISIENAGHLSAVENPESWGLAVSAFLNEIQG